eukprot:754711-Hanusia_phi.AAC.2
MTPSYALSNQLEGDFHHLAVSGVSLETAQACCLYLHAFRCHFKTFVGTIPALNRSTVDESSYRRTPRDWYERLERLLVGQ